jgi:hypothetical protein
VIGKPFGIGLHPKPLIFRGIFKIFPALICRLRNRLGSVDLYGGENHMRLNFGGNLAPVNLSSGKS